MGRDAAQIAHAPATFAHVPVSLVALARYFLYLGTVGFGGPIALTAAIQRDLVDEREWITPAEYKEGLALAQLAPSVTRFSVTSAYSNEGGPVIMTVFNATR